VCVGTCEDHCLQCFDAVARVLCGCQKRHVICKNITDLVVCEGLLSELC